jgi:hypothetical protein
MPNSFDFYKRAYMINQAFGDASLTATPLNNIRMGDDSTDKGIAFAHTKSLYAKEASATYSRSLFNVGGAVVSPELWGNKFSVSSSGRDHQARYLADTDIGPATPKLNEVVDNIWDGTCYPCALGDTRDNKTWGDLRDGAWVEAGCVGSTTNADINIYRTNPTGGAPIWLNTIPAQNQFNATSTNMRVFTSPSFTSDNIPNLTIPNGHQLIAFFAWSSTGGPGGNPIFYYELFAWDIVNNLLGSVVNKDLTTLYSFYDPILYTGKHDIFHPTNWISEHTYRQNIEYLIFFSPGSGSGGQINQIDLASGSITRRAGSAGAYSDIYDIFCYGDNVAQRFYTFFGSQGLTATVIDTITTTINPKLIGLNVFDADYRSFGDGADNHFYFGDDKPNSGSTGISGIVGWSVKFDVSSGMITGGDLGAYEQRTLYNNPFSGGGNPGTPYTLKRVVLVAPMQLIVGPGPGLGTQNLIRIICGWYRGSWYRAGAFITYDNNSTAEDFIAMNHGYCEDCTGKFDASGSYQTGVAPAPTDGLPVGAGNQHILTVNYNFSSYLFSQNTGLSYETQTWGLSSLGSHYMYVLYLGAFEWDSAAFQGSPNYSIHGKSYLYISITGTNSDFSLPTTELGDPAVHPTGNGPGGLRILVFYG